MDFKITEGITNDQINDLIKYSNEDDLILNTTSDRTRFKDEAAVKNWLGKNRNTYTLAGNQDKLLGIIWFGKEFNKDVERSYGITFAIRIYEAGRGKGYSKTFLKKSFKKYKETPEYINNPNKGIWLVTNSDNLPALSLYKKMGFKNAGKTKENRIIMITNKIL